MCEQPHPPFPLHPREAPPAYLPSLYGERPSPQYALVMWSALRASRRLSTSIKFDPQSTPAKIHFPPVAPPKLTSPEYPLQNSFSPCCSANIHLLPVPCAGGGGGFHTLAILGTVPPSGGPGGHPGHPVVSGRVSALVVSECGRVGSPCGRRTRAQHTNTQHTRHKGDKDRKNGCPNAKG